MFQADRVAELTLRLKWTQSVRRQQRALASAASVLDLHEEGTQDANIETLLKYVRAPEEFDDVIVAGISRELCPHGLAPNGLYKCQKYKHEGKPMYTWKMDDGSSEEDEPDASQPARFKL
eukprot:4042552-Amphidinium_carterae.1